MADIKTTKDALEWIEQRQKAAEKQTDQGGSSNPCSNVFTRPRKRPCERANHINRSSLFAPIARGRRKFHRQYAMVGRADIVISYTGEQLDEADADLMLQLLF